MTSYFLTLDDVEKITGTILMALCFWGIGLAVTWWLIRPREVKMTNLESKK